MSWRIFKKEWLWIPTEGVAMLRVSVWFPPRKSVSSGKKRNWPHTQIVDYDPSPILECRNLWVNESNRSHPRDPEGSPIRPKPPSPPCAISVPVDRPPFTLSAPIAPLTVGAASPFVPRVGSPNPLGLRFIWAVFIFWFWFIWANILVQNNDFFLYFQKNTGLHDWKADA